MDSDTVGDACDNCYVLGNRSQSDMDQDGEGDVCDTDDGLLTLYSHLSIIDVEEGQEVERGVILGRTGATGLAGGRRTGPPGRLRPRRRRRDVPL